MAGGSYLVQRGGTFSFRCRVPRDLCERAKRREIVRALHERQPIVAKFMALAVALRLEQLWARVRMTETTGEIDALIETWFKAECDKAWRLYASGDLARALVPAGADTNAERRINRDIMAGDADSILDRLKEDFDNGNYSAAFPATRKIVAKLSEPFNEHDQRFTMISKTIMEGIGEIQTARMLWSEGNEAYHPSLRKKDTLAAPKETAMPSLPEDDKAPTLADAVETSTDAEKQKKTVPKVTVEALIAAWAKESGRTGKALYDRERTGALLVKFLGHNDANRVTADDVVKWKEARLEMGLSPRTVANDIGELRPIWAWGKANRKLTFAENPFAGLAPKTTKRGKKVRWPYDEDEARRLLVDARAVKQKSLRWLPWVLCFTGARITEACQSTTADVKQTSKGVWYLSIHEDDDGRSIKTSQSERQVPLHSALIAEGFPTYVQSLPAGSPLFPDFKPDKFGSRGGTATKTHGRWVRKTVGITDKKKDPAHAWRHRFEDQARIAGLSAPMTDALMGHLNATNESEGYGRGFGFMPDVTAPWVDKMATPLAAL